MEETICRQMPCLSSGMGSETFFRLRAAGYLGDLGKKSMGGESGPCIKEKTSDVSPDDGYNIEKLLSLWIS